MDIRLPDIDGYSLVRKIRLIRPELKIIAQTAYASQDERQIAIEAGCVDYISKPISKYVLLPMIRKYILNNPFKTISN